MSRIYKIGEWVKIQANSVSAIGFAIDGDLTAEAFEVISEPFRSIDERRWLYRLCPAIEEKPFLANEMDLTIAFTDNPLLCWMKGDK